MSKKLDQMVIDELGLAEQSKGVYRVAGKYGTIMYFPGSAKWQCCGSTQRGDLDQFRQYLKSNRK